MSTRSRSLRPSQDYSLAVIAEARRAALHAGWPRDPLGCEIALLRLTLQDLFHSPYRDLSRAARLLDAITCLVLLRHRLSGAAEGVLPLHAGRATHRADRLVATSAA